MASRDAGGDCDCPLESESYSPADSCSCDTMVSPSSSSSEGLEERRLPLRAALPDCIVRQCIQCRIGGLRVQIGRNLGSGVDMLLCSYRISRDFDAWLRIDCLCWRCRWQQWYFSLQSGTGAHKRRINTQALFALALPLSTTISKKHERCKSA